MHIFTRVVGTGPEPAVFLHGLFGQGRNFTQIAKDLADVATSLLVDLPDHGRSEHTEQFGFDAYADALVDVVSEHAARCGRRGVTLVGHSLGGKVAMRFALRHPELVERLVVVDISPVAGWTSNTFTTIIPALQRIDLQQLPGRADAESQLAVDIDSPAVRGFLLQNLRHEHGRWFWQANLPLIASSIEQIGDWPAVATGLTYDGPVLWVAGQDSTYVLPQHADPMRTLFPRTRLVTIKNAGHWVHSDQPAVFTTMLRQVLTSGQ